MIRPGLEEVNQREAGKAGQPWIHQEADRGFVSYPRMGGSLESEIC